MPAQQEADDADVLIEIGPVDALTLANESPACTLIRRGLEKPGVPGKRDGDRAPIQQLHAEDIGRDYDGLCEGAMKVNLRSIHASSS
jgi:hypothetical protein